MNNKKRPPKNVFMEDNLLLTPAQCAKKHNCSVHSWYQYRAFYKAPKKKQAHQMLDIYDIGLIQELRAEGVSAKDCLP